MRPRPPIIAAAITLLGGLAVAAALSNVMLGAERERANTIFLRQVEARTSALAGGFGDVLDIVRANQALFAAVGSVGRDQFHAFTQPLLATHPYLRAIAYHRFVDARERRRFESERARLIPHFGILERRDDALVASPDRLRYLVVDYIEPLPANARLLGYDSLSSADQARAFDRAMDSGEPVSTPVLSLLEPLGRVGIVVQAPIYRHGAVPDGVAARRAAATGGVAVALDVDLLVERNLAGVSKLLDRRGMAFELLGPGAAGLRSVIRVDHLAERSMPRWYGWPSDPVLSTSRRIQFAGEPWELRMAVRSTELAGSPAPVITLALGVLLSVVLAAYVRARVQRLQHVQALVRRRTADLLDALSELRLYRRAIDASANAIILIDARRADLPIDYVNPAFERMRGVGAADVIGRGLLEFGDREPDQAAVAELRRAMRDQREGHVGMRLRRRDGRDLHAEVYVAPVRDLYGKLTHFVMTQYDVTQAKRYEEELEARARFDALTGLPNRVLLQDRIDSAIGAPVHGEPVWVVALDLDHFKFVNDTLGHDAGDEFLRAAAQRIAGAVRRGDTVARTGGDEFVLVLPGRPRESDAADMVRAVLDALAQPLMLHGQELVPTGSAGIAAYPADGDTAPMLLQHAEVAMYRAKDLGRNTMQFYLPTMNARARERMALEGALRGALLQNEFELYYQPQVDLATGDVVGLEALIRWRHPRFGMVRPDRFIQLAEETGLIVPIGAWVLRTACRQNRAWQRSGHQRMRIAVNLSARQFAESDLTRDIARVLHETGMAPDSLDIEITESLVMSDVESAIRTMLELKRMGVQLSIDDFGTGHSSLSYLRRFPVDVVKIDGSFVRDIPHSADDSAMVAAIIELARGLRKRVIAEGVETEAQLDYLKRRGCDEVQGHVFGQARPAAEIDALLRAERSPWPAALGSE